MHRLTQLTVDESKARHSKGRDGKWQLKLEDLSRRGVLHGNTGFPSFLEIGYRYINALLDDLFRTEKEALSHEPSLPHENYFQDLKKEIDMLVTEEHDIIRSKTLNYFGRKDSTTRDSFLHNINKHAANTRESTNRRVEKLQEELRLGIPMTSSKTTININGDVGVFNTGTVYGSVNGKIEKIDNQGLAEALNHILEAIKNSDIKDDNKINQMQNVEFLIDQCETPKAQRNRGTINVVLNCLSTATNLALVWGQYGPIIVEFFKNQF